MQLFISYAHEDVARVRELVNILAAGGHSVWFDDQILPGQDWKQELGQKIGVSDAFVYALTHSSVNSEWCQWEFATAVRGQKSIIPVVIESAISLPQSLKSLQYADFANGATPIAAAKLIGALNSFQKVAPSQAPAVAEEPKGVPSRAWENAKHWTDKIVSPQHKPQDVSEEVLGKFGVSLRRGIEAVGGRVIVTNERLLFEAHGINVQKSPLAIPLSEISGVTAYNSLGLVPNGIRVQCRSGQEYRFITFSREKLLNLLAERIGTTAKFCSVCGNPLRDRPKFCSKCGTPVQA